MPKGDRLTPKQKKWAVGYLTHGNASQAAREAGYGARERGVENISKRIHEKFLDELGDTSGALNAVTPDALFSKLMELITDAEQEGTKARGIELAMRAKGMFTDKIQVENIGQDTDQMLEALKAKDPALYEMMAQRLGATEH